MTNKEKAQMKADHALRCNVTEQDEKYGIIETVPLTAAQIVERDEARRIIWEAEQEKRKEWMERHYGDKECRDFENM